MGTNNGYGGKEQQRRHRQVAANVTWLLWVPSWLWLAGDETSFWVPMSLSEGMGTPSTGGHFGEKCVLGGMSDRWSVLQHKHKNKLASCGLPSFPEGNVMHGESLTGSALDLTEAG